MVIGWHQSIIPPLFWQNWLGPYFIPVSGKECESLTRVGFLDLQTKEETTSHYISTFLELKMKKENWHFLVKWLKGFSDPLIWHLVQISPVLRFWSFCLYFFSSRSFSVFIGECRALIVLNLGYGEKVNVRKVLNCISSINIYWLLCSKYTFTCLKYINEKMDKGLCLHGVTVLAEINR